jgi:hypothetical protein
VNRLYLHRTLFIIILIMFDTLGLLAQTTKVKGRVTDAETGEGIAYAGVYFKNSTVGVSTDDEGYYTIEVRDNSLTVLSASILGYESSEKPVNVGSFNEINFSLKPIVDQLKGAVVKADNHYAKYILRKINEGKAKNNPELQPGYTTDVYSKIETDLQNADKKSIKRLLPKNFMFVYDYMDTSVVSGQPYLPVMISESSSEYSHRTNPEQKREIIKASRISGIDQEETAAQFTGSMHVKTNFYDDFINIFEVRIPSPAIASGMLFYDYFIIDSLNIEGRKTYKIRFHPKKLISSPAFDGEMAVDAQDFALREVHAKLKKGSNVNWVRDLVIDVQNQRLPDSSWFYKQDKIYADFSVVLTDSTHMLSVIGRRQIDYMNPRYVDFGNESLSDAKSEVQLNDHVLNRDEAYWEKVRPYELSAKEKGIYQMVDSIKNVPLYQNVETVVRMIATGFWDVGEKFSVGPISTLYSFNNLEGSRFQIGVRTNKYFSRKWRLYGYGAFGTKDGNLKGGGIVEYMFDNNPTRKIMAYYKHDAMQLGMVNYEYGSGNIFTSLLTKRGGQKLSMVNDFSLCYMHEINQDINLSLAFENRRIFSNKYVPMYTPDSSSFNSVSYSQFRFESRFSWEEIITRGVFDKYYVFTDYPIITTELIGSIKGIGKNTYSFFRPEISAEYTLRIPPVGNMRMELSAGKIFGTVPYPMLNIFQGNGTYFLNKETFACMDYYEFAADSWATFSVMHDFKGFFLGKIPGIRKLNLREVATFRIAYGSLSDKNNGIAGDPHAKSKMLFPEGMTTLTKPYMEAGVGITNIFRMLRVDAYWRLNHRWHTVNGVREKVDNRFVVNIGFEFNF